MEKDNRKLISLGKGPSGGGGDTTWGSITGIISSQTDLMEELNKKANTSSVPTKTSDITNDSGYITLSDVPSQVNSDWNSNSGVSQILNKPTLSTVATSGSYNDLTNKPTLATVATSGSYNDLSNKPTIPTATSDLTNDSGYITISDVPAQVQSDWTESDNTSPAYIVGKPTIPTVNNATITFQDSQGSTIDSFTLNQSSNKTITLPSSGGGAVWGSITGTLSNQTDLNTALGNKANTSDLATVATSGSYSDLSNTPTIPSNTSDLTNDSGFRSVIEVTDMTQTELLDFYTNYATLIDTNTYVVNGYPFSTLTVTDPLAGTVLVLEYNTQFKDQAAGATAGTIDVTVGVLYIFADGTSQSTSMTYTVPQNSSLATVAKSGSYNDLTDKPSIPAAQVQSDWNQSDNTAVDYIKNKPSIPAAQVNADWNAVSGVAQILNKPTIPAAQIQSDWNQSNNQSVDYIKNKPSMSTETLTFVDANNVSTTVVVYTQPQV